MSESRCAHARHLAGLRRDVEDDVVGMRRITSEDRRRAGWHEVKVQTMPSPPRDVVVGARRIAADANRAEEHTGRVVECEAAAEHVDATDAAAHHRIIGLPVVGRAAAIGDVDIDRIAFLQTEETAARLNCAVEIGGRQRETGEAERVRRVGLLRGDDAAPRPLVTAVGARECDRTHDPVTVDHGRPHVQVEPAIGGSTRRRKLLLQRCLIRQVRTGSGPLRVSDVCRRQHTYQGQRCHNTCSRHWSPPRVRLRAETARKTIRAPGLCQTKSV